MKELFGLFRAWSLGGFKYDGIFLVSVGRGRGLRAVHDFFDDSNLGIFVLLLTTLILKSAVHDNGQDKEHPEENSNSTAKDEGDGSTFPTTQIHDGVMNAINERSFAKVVVAVTAVRVVSTVRTTIMRCFHTNDFNGIFAVGRETDGSADER